MSKKYNITDGKLLLTLQEAENGWFVVTSPSDPALITQAKSIREAFSAAKDALSELTASRADAGRFEKHSPRQIKRSA
jgi:predicted RNase H-like HicB family nuclease